MMVMSARSIAMTKPRCPLRMSRLAAQARRDPRWKGRQAGMLLGARKVMDGEPVSEWRGVARGAPGKRDKEGEVPA